MDRLTQMQAFVRTVELGSMSAAAQDMRVGQSTVSKWLASLEDQVGATLLERTTRTQRLTPAGEALLERGRRLLEAWEEAMTSSAPTMSGLVRLSLPTVFGTRHVVPHLGAFLDAHPRIDLELMLSDHYAHLVDERIDLAIRVGLSVPSSMRAVRLGGTDRVLVASADYLDKHGVPRHPSELELHRALVHRTVAPTIWTFTGQGQEVLVRPRGRASADHSEALRSLACQGQGIALLARWLVHDDLHAATLQPLLPTWSAPEAPIRAVLPPSRRVPPRVRALMEHLRQSWDPALTVVTPSSVPT